MDICSKNSYMDGMMVKSALKVNHLLAFAFVIILFFIIRILQIYYLEKDQYIKAKQNELQYIHDSIKDQLDTYKAVSEKIGANVSSNSSLLTDSQISNIIKVIKFSQGPSNSNKNMSQIVWIREGATKTAIGPYGRMLTIPYMNEQYFTDLTKSDAKPIHYAYDNFLDEPALILSVPYLNSSLCNKGFSTLRIRLEDLFTKSFITLDTNSFALKLNNSNSPLILSENSKKQVETNTLKVNGHPITLSINSYESLPLTYTLQKLKNEAWIYFLILLTHLIAIIAYHKKYEFVLFSKLRKELGEAKKTNLNQSRLLSEQTAKLENSGHYISLLKSQNNEFQLLKKEESLRITYLIESILKDTNSDNASDIFLSKDTIYQELKVKILNNYIAPLKSEKYSIHMLIKQSIALVAPFAFDKNNHIKTSTDDFSVINTDAFCFKVLVFNLLHNSIARSSQGDEINIFLQIDASNNQHFYLTIEDSGIAFNQQELLKFAKYQNEVTTFEESFQLNVDEVNSCITSLGGLITNLSIDNSGKKITIKFPIHLKLTKPSRRRTSLKLVPIVKNEA